MEGPSLEQSRLELPVDEMWRGIIKGIPKDREVIHEDFHCLFNHVVKDGQHTPLECARSMEFGKYREPSGNIYSGIPLISQSQLILNGSEKVFTVASLTWRALHHFLLDGNGIDCLRSWVTTEQHLAQDLVYQTEFEQQEERYGEQNSGAAGFGIGGRSYTMAMAERGFPAEVLNLSNTYELDSSYSTCSHYRNASKQTARCSGKITRIMRRTLTLLLVFIMCEQQIHLDSVLMRFMDDLLALDLIVYFGFSDRRLEQTVTFSIPTNSERCAIASLVQDARLQCHNPSLDS
ncbi:hypothetical protein Tco_0401567 [Tanacetum coccineum]